MSEEVKILEYETRIKIIRNREVIIEYDIPSYEIKNKLCGSENGEKPFQKPKHYQYYSHEEEKKLRERGPILNQYLDFIKSSNLKHKHKFICELYRLSKRTSKAMLERIVERALQYKVTSMDILTSMASWMIKIDGNQYSFDDFIPSDFKDRSVYREGCFSEESEIDYQQFLEDDDASG